MNIPLDRLYHFLEDVVDDNILIYRFIPHGSKKLCDLLPLYDYDPSINWLEQMLMPALICHDQEPLNFDLWTHDEIWQNYMALRPNEMRCQSENFAQIIKSMHLRSCINLTLNTHDLTMISHSEKNSAELERYQQHGFVGVYWWSHALIARDWFRYAEHDKKLCPKIHDISKDFLIYNRAWSGTREYRLTFVEQLVNNNLIDCCQTAFNAWDNDVHYSNHVFANSRLAVVRNDLEQYFSPTQATACYSADYDSKDYQHIGIEVVLETLFDDNRWHLTEKTLRPIACGRPFILAATSGSLEYLRSYGFETFGNYIDESYDQIQDPVLRMSAIIEEMKRIRQLPADEKTQLWTKLYNIAQRNKDLFFDNQWVDNIVAEYVENFNQALIKTKLSQQATYWKKYLELSKTDPVLIAEDQQRSPAVRNSMQQLSNFIKF